MPALPGTSLTGPHPGSAGVPPASGPQARRMAKRATPTLAGSSARPPRSRASPVPVLGSAPKADLDGIGRLRRGGCRLGRVASVGALRAFGPLRARCPRSQGHRSQGHTLGARASRPQAGHRPATWASGRRPRSRASPVPVLDRAPKADLDGIGRLGWGSGWLGGVVLVAALRAFGPMRARCPRSQEHRSQGRPRRHWAPRVGGWPARGCRSCRRFAGLRPGAGQRPALPGGPRSQVAPAPVLGADHCHPGVPGAVLTSAPRARARCRVPVPCRRSAGGSP